MDGGSPTKGENGMKTMAITMAVMVGIAGLNMAGATYQTDSFAKQFVGSSLGVCLFAGAGWVLTEILRGE